RAPDIGRRKKRELNARRQYADDAAWVAIQSNGLANNAGVAAKAAMPERVTDDDYRFTRGLAFIEQKKTAKLRLDAQNVKEISRDARRRHLQGFAASGEIEGVIGVGHHPGKRLAAVMHKIKAVQAAAV